MLRFITVIFALLLADAISAQNFPDAQKQPRQKEMRHQHRHFARQAHRRHIRRGTAYNKLDNTCSPPILYLAFFDDRKNAILNSSN